MSNKYEYRTVILICGKASSGKSTVAQILSNIIDIDIESLVSEATTCTPKTLLLNNGDNAKSIAKNVFRWNGIKDEKGRQLLIDITNTGYALDQFFWEKQTLDVFNSRFTSSRGNINTLIIPDWRYLQTYSFFIDNGFKVICVRVESDREIDGGTHDNDSSENDFKTFEVDHVITNNRSKNDLVLDLFNFAKTFNLWGDDNVPNK